MTTTLSQQTIFNRIQLPTTVGFGRVLQTEARKLCDTRGMAMLLAFVGIAVIGAGALLRFVLDVTATPEVGWQSHVGSMAGVAAVYVLAIVAVLQVTSEWSARTGLVTYALEPRRYRVIAAKLTVTICLCLVALLFCYLVAIGFFGLEGPGFSGKLLGSDIANMLAIVLMAFAWALLLRNTAAAVVLIFALPMALQIMLSIGGRLAEIASWLDVSTALRELFFIDATATGVAHLVVASLVWIVVPMIAGFWLNQRAEIK